MSKEPDKADLANSTGPAPAGDVVAGVCQRCGRSELVKTTMPKADDARATQAIVDTAGDEVKPGASVTVCALCGAIQTSKSLKDGGPPRSSKPKAKRKPSRKARPARAKKTTTAKTTPTTTRRSSTRRTRAGGR